MYLSHPLGKALSFSRFVSPCRVTLPLTSLGAELPPTRSFQLPRLTSLLLALIVLTRVPALAQLPIGWSDEDIGFPSQAGSASEANGIWAVSGGGADIWGSSDQFNFAYESSTDSAVLVARVTGLSNTDPWAKAGVMFRDSNDPSAIYADVVATPGNGVSFQWRTSTGGQSRYSQVSGVLTPLWVK